MKVTLFLRNRESGEKSVLEFEGDAETLTREIDQMKMFLTKHHFEILDWKADFGEGRSAETRSEPCISCGRPGINVYRKVERSAEGIAISRYRVSLCRKDLDRFLEDPKERARILTLGIEMHVAGPQ